jgi:cytochrome c-type biogenesis protein CcmE
MKLQLNSILIVFALVNLFTISNVQAQTANSHVYSVEEIIQKAPTLVGQTVQVKGLVSHICEKSGRKLFLAVADNSKTFRFNAGDKIEVFDENAVDSTVIATGVITETRITLEDLAKQEKAAIAAAEKIAKATKKVAADHCTSEAKANGENTAATPLQRIQTQKDQISKQVAEGKNNYLSFYAANNCNEYKIVK